MHPCRMLGVFPPCGTPFGAHGQCHIENCWPTMPFGQKSSVSPYRPCPKFARHKRSHFIPSARIDRCDWQSRVLPRSHTACYGIGVRITQVAQDMGCD